MSRRQQNLLLAVSMAFVAAGWLGCDNSSNSGPVANCTSQMITEITNDGFYTLCDITGLEPTSRSVSSVQLQIQDDDDTQNFDLPWDFTFYGTVYSTVSVDTNGNIWMGADVADDYDFDLINAGDPVITAWNQDLDSQYFGQGVRVKVYSNPARVVFDWDTETYDDGDNDLLNNFQIVLYRTGEIVFHYIDFDPMVTCSEAGSGISVGDNTEYIDLSSEEGTDVCDLPNGTSYMFEPIPLVM